MRKMQSRSQRIPSHLVPKSKRFLDAVCRNVHFYRSYLVCLCGLFYSKARVRTHHREFLPGARRHLPGGDMLQSQVEEALVNSCYPYKNVFINNLMQQQLAQADVVVCYVLVAESPKPCQRPAAPKSLGFLGGRVCSSAEVRASKTACPKRARVSGCAVRGGGRSD